MARYSVEMAIDHSLTYTKFRLRNIPHKLRLKHIRETVRSLGIVGVGRYLDVGSSNGFVTNEVQNILHSKVVWGIDYSTEHVMTAQSRYKDFRFLQADLNGQVELGLTFDFITCFETIEHTGRLSNAIDQIYKHLSPGGTLLITVPIEIGWIGIAKFAMKNFVYRDSFQDITGTKWNYLRALLRGDRMSLLRDTSCLSYGEHYGFDHREINAHLDKLQIPYACSRKFSTKLYVIKKPVPPIPLLHGS